MRRPHALAALIVTIMAATPGAQSPRGLKVLLLYDMEGITAADEYRKTTFSHPAQDAEGRRSLTDDVNAAIAGLAAGGAAAVVVVDGHGSGRAMGAARLKIPVIMVSGDDPLERELRRNLPWVKYAAVKPAVNVGKAEPLPREEASRRIEAAARDALQSLSQMKPMEFAGPYRFAAKFEEPAQALNASLWPGSELNAGQQTVQIRASDFEDGYRASLWLLGLAGAARGAAAAQTAIGTLPNAADVRKSMTDWSYDRWINGVPLPAPSAPGTRFWGAR